MLVITSLLILVGCDSKYPFTEDDEIEIAFTVANNVVETMTSNATTRATVSPTDTEKSIADLYLLLFPQTGGVIRQYVETKTVSTSEYSLITGSEMGVKLLSVKQNQANSSDVFVIANCAQIKSQLDAVASKDDLNAVLQTISQPEDMKADYLLMIGQTSVAHNFIENNQLKSIPLYRTMARVDVEMTLATEYQSSLASDYGYRCLKFGAELWLTTHADAQTADKVVSTLSTPQVKWNTVTTGGTPINKISFSTYLNEYNNTGNATAPCASIEVKLPFNPTSGSLPPPEFGGDIYRFNLPIEVKRNTVYRYTLEVK